MRGTKISICVLRTCNFMNRSSFKIARYVASDGFIVEAQFAQRKHRTLRSGGSLHKTIKGEHVLVYYFQTID